ncbi:hypothetical protein [Actinomadura montaniterrae]|uniref:Uncharacterized protein n=1 Tax=Actinomadura montaniterrae TaxID=1803903 RepID=A0A6L3VTF9_9ACTN|nr:hypothetical protein [Actinomadura montaniterrae]KAB2371122.1 hypothetical protein F9B16_32920 [Actinomadura montaniterrae]
MTSPDAALAPLRAQVDTVVYEGHSYRVWRGRVLLDWSHEPMRYHARGCLLCCTVRVQRRPGSPPRHPDPCDSCGFNRPRTRPPDPCRYCRRTAHLTGPDGRPIHKACLEADILATFRRAA